MSLQTGIFDRMGYIGIQTFPDMLLNYSPGSGFASKVLAEAADN